jgi:hypothetical protein
MKHEAPLSLYIMDSSLNVCMLCSIMHNTYMDVMNECEMNAWF